jgi:hypothetical protein
VARAASGSPGADLGFSALIAAKWSLFSGAFLLDLILRF